MLKLRKCCFNDIICLYIYCISEILKKCNNIAYTCVIIENIIEKLIFQNIYCIIYAFAIAGMRK